jgi:putative ABC transport system permease protein
MLRSWILPSIVVVLILALGAVLYFAFGLVGIFGGLFLAIATASLLVLLAEVVLVVLLFAPVRKVPLTYNFRNLSVRWKTSLLTLLAFTLVVSLLVIMLAFVNGMTRLTEVSGHPENVIVLSQGATDEQFSSMMFTDAGDIERQPGVLTNEQGRPLCSTEQFLVITQPLPAEPGQPERRRFVQVRGLLDPEISGRVHGLNLYPGGSWFSQAGVQDLPAEGTATGETAIQAVLGEGAARQLGHDFKKEPLRVGDVLPLGGRKWIVVGILQSAGATFDSEVWAKGPYVAPLYGKEAISSLVLRTRDADTARAVAEDLSTNYKKSSVNAQVETEYYSKLSATNRQFLGAIGFLAIFMALGGMAGVMNTMFAAISQRTKDIGMLRILGFSRWQVLHSFFLEALVLALVGGLIGCALGSLAHGWSATSIISSGTGGGKSVVLKLVVDARTILVGLLFTLIMGGLGGLLPSLSAMRLRPLESLR